MGEVYRAHDSKLRRDVALKVLPSRHRFDASRQSRFEREALALAALNHPNIATVYGVEDGGGVQALVMELIDGETLADRIAGRTSASPINEALEIARQIVDALDAAHERGIIHRDLKPANLKVRRDGVVKVLDFGLVKALQTDRSVDYRSGSRLMAARVDTSAGVRVLSRQVVFQPFLPPLYDDYDIHPDGRTLALVRPAGELRGREIAMLLHWPARLKPSE
jgi:serine/threonine protein kinase